LLGVKLLSFRVTFSFLKVLTSDWRVAFFFCTSINAYTVRNQVSIFIWYLNENTIDEFTFSRSGGFIEPLAATVAAIAASMESGSNGVPCEEMDSPKSDNNEDIEIVFEKEQNGFECQ
jgi:EamA domain-containing membrane protein RarD